MTAMTANPFAALLRDVPRRVIEDGGDALYHGKRITYLPETDVLAALAAAVPADLAEAGKVLELVQGLRELGHLHMLGRCLSAADMITALLASLAAQEAQINGLMNGTGAASQMALDYMARAEAAETALAAMTKERDAAEAELVGAFEAAAVAVEELSKAPGTTWGQVKGHIRAMGDVGDRRAYQSMRTALAAERAKTAKLVEAGKRVLAPLDEPCRHDHHGYCQAHFIEADCSVAALRAAITEAGQ